MKRKAGVSGLGLRDVIIRLYRGTAAYADGVPEDVLDRLHIETKLDKAVLEAVRKGHDVVLTGNPGDGKTHLLRILASRILKLSPKASILLDASEQSNAEIITAWKTARSKKVPFCAAVNEGVLNELSESFKGFSPVGDAQAAVENSIGYVTAANPACEKTLDGSVAVFDLSMRNVLSEEIVGKVLNKICDAAQTPPPLEVKNEFSDFWRNLELVCCPVFRSRLQRLFDRITRRGFHATLRELQAFGSYLLFYGRDPLALASNNGTSQHFVSELLFSGEGRLFEALRKGFDPAKASHPKLDLSILTAQIDDAEWAHEWAREVHSLTPTQIQEMGARRRRYYFFCQSGEELLRIAYGADADYGKFLQMNERDMIRHLLNAINSAFNISEQRDSLQVWKCHRFDHSDERGLCSTAQLSRVAFEIARPRLRHPMSEAFEMVEDHVLLRLKSDPKACLRVDFPLFVLLQNAQHGLPILSLGNELTRRLWQFMERLSGHGSKENDEEVAVVIRDVHTSTCIRVTVDLENNKYLAVEDA